VKPKPFALERYFAEYEFSVKYLLSSSDCQGLPMKAVLDLADDETRALWDGLSLGYTEEPGLPALRAEAAATYKGIVADEILTGAPEELIFIAMNCLLQPGDHVVCTFPGYQSLYELAETIGCRVTRWEPNEDAGWHFDPRDLRTMVRPETRLMVVNFPHNPTGSLPSQAEFEEIVGIAAERGITLFSDEMYRSLELDPAERLPAACELYEGAISLTGMSKVYGMAGTRMGWLVVRDPRRYAELLAFKDYTTICSSAPSEILTLIALRARDAIIAAHRRRVEINLAALDAFLAQWSGLFRWVRPRAGTIGLARLREGMSAAAFCARVVHEAGIMVLPSTTFDFGDSHVRVGFGRENLPEVLSVLDGYLRDAGF
jgi:aspartate/methionine/tyrosine aminotransferase